MVYAPVDKPRIALSVILEQAGHGGSMAAPVTAKMMRRYFGVPDPTLATGSATPVVVTGD
ncbi:hypothetical protein D3C87_1980220 [compost metagenome]